ncbi:MAG: hypothetical protein K0U37_01265 [Gammaproteobacteria bacterium]|nr:hypothetical protein [Gammaproteobacteria bacterium]
MFIKAIIFDVGGVLNKGRPDFKTCFKAHGITLTEDLWANKNCKALIHAFSTGKYGLNENSAKAFFEDIRIKASIDKTICFDQFKQAWNATIISLNYELINQLTHLKKQGYRLFILSDSNFLHREHEEKLYQQKYPGKTLTALFEHCYFSHETGCSKHASTTKSPQAWLQILNENALDAHECLFIDDTKTNLNKAESLGFFVLHYTKASNFQTLLDKLETIR